MFYHSIFKPDLFDRQVFIVTGGGTGIGRCIAYELVSLGASVAICARKPRHITPTYDTLNAAAPGHVFADLCDIRQRDSVETFVEKTLQTFGRIDGLVNNAGGQSLSPAEDIPPDKWNTIIETNLTGTWHMTQAVMQRALREHGGAIVNITLENARGTPGMAHSGAARAGVQNLTRTLAVEWARFGIRVNAIAPGMINSGGLQKYPSAIRKRMADFAKAIPAKRFGSESEIAAVVTFLLSPGAGYLSGQTLWVDGAASLWSTPYEIDDHDNWPDAYNGLIDTP